MNGAEAGPGKLAELDQQIAAAQAAREAIRHGLRCPHDIGNATGDFKRRR